jgi:predicted nuclease of predicted toxin-antitoxin system
MKFLIDEDLPRSTGELLKNLGFEFFDVRDIGLRGASDSEIAAYAKKQNLCLITGDTGFADIRNYPPKEYPGIIVLHIPRDSTAKSILNLLDGALKQESLLSNIPGKLAIVEPGRIRFRSRQ